MSDDQDKPETTTCTTFERVGDAVLVSMGDGGTLYWPTIDEARIFATALMRICAFGRDTLDDLGHTEEPSRGDGA